jgi:ribosome biogenesis GTPase
VRFRIVSADQGVIEELLPRHGAITRARSETGAAQVLLANADHAGLVFAVREPEPHFGLLDRYLSICERAGVGVTIIFNKIDLGISPETEVRAQLYQNLGYMVVYTSATTGKGLDILRNRLRGRVSLLTGPSGVGKSSLLNDLIPGAHQRIGTVSEATGKGRHTTTGARLLPLPDGGWLADSAGIRELALWHVPPEDLIGAFVELRPYVGACRYEDCDHSEDEEGCAVRAAFSEGRITPERFASFERLLSEARETGMVQR